MSDGGRAAAAAWQPGDVILGLYEVLAVHSGGGMGLVYRARHRRWNIDLALKSPRPDLFQTERDKAVFEREAETWVRLGLHPHVVTCHYVRPIDGIPRIFAEYVTGGSLEDWIRSGRLYAGTPEQSLARILDIAIQIAWGLEHAHE
jgi:serine/threonine protein kinase